MPIVAKTGFPPAPTPAPVPSHRPDVIARARVRHAPVQAGASSPSSMPKPSPRPKPSPELQLSPSDTNPIDAPGDYAVGYKKPPHHTRFQKGVSGNRRGRPRGARGMKTLVREMLTEKVTVRTASGMQRMSKMQAMLHKIAEQAFAGNMRALQQLVSLYSASVPDEPTKSAGTVAAAEPVDMDAHDEAILAMLRASLTGGTTSDAGEVR